MAEFDTVIKGGMVIDGSRTPRYKADIAISNGVVAEIGFIDEARADKVLDADGMIVAPGFVDLHTHYDAQVFWDPYCSISSWHGITTVVIGNCGFGFAPVAPEARERAMLSTTSRQSRIVFSYACGSRGLVTDTSNAAWSPASGVRSSCRCGRRSPTSKCRPTRTNSRSGAFPSGAESERSAGPSTMACQSSGDRA